MIASRRLSSGQGYLRSVASIRCEPRRQLMIRHDVRNPASFRNKVGVYPHVALNFPIGRHGVPSDGRNRIFGRTVVVLGSCHAGAGYLDFVCRRGIAKVVQLLKF